MTFSCVDIRTGQLIGDYTLPIGQYDPYGTEYMFGENTYILQSTHIDGRKGKMYFIPKK